MTEATLKLDDGPDVSGEIVDSGGDYIRLRSTTDMSQDQLSQYANGEIEIDGKPERVLLESVMPATEAEDQLELTMRRMGQTS